MFEFATAARIVFGNGALATLREASAALGARRVLLVTGARAAAERGLLARLEALVPVALHLMCGREPDVATVDGAAEQARTAGVDGVVAVGGGSVLDFGKALRALVTSDGSVRDYLEGVGTKRALSAPPLPMIAVPTTAGTGSEVTKNAVISGPGFKKSLRSPALIPSVALVDPELTIGTPRAVTAACGMDALTQLVEAYLSTQASPLTDGLALTGLCAAAEGLCAACAAPDDPVAREQMALASLLGGVCLANAGLGAVHGIASPLGASFPVPHGVACAALLPEVVRANQQAAQGTPVAPRVEARCAAVATALAPLHVALGRGPSDGSDPRGLYALLCRLRSHLDIPSLATFGVTPEHIPALAQAAGGSNMRTNPVALDTATLCRIIEDAC